MGDTRRATLCYVPRGDMSLMINRDGTMDNDPLLGTIVAPGGGIKYGERPVEGVGRELLEETNLEAESIMYRGTVLFDHSGREGNYKGNQSVDIFCATGVCGKQFEMSESGPLIWTPNSDIARLSDWNGGDYVVDWLRDGRLFDAVIRHGSDGKKAIDVSWTSGRGVADNPYWDV